MQSGLEVGTDDPEGRYIPTKPGGPESGVWDGNWWRPRQEGGRAIEVKNKPGAHCGAGEAAGKQEVRLPDRL